MNTMNLTKTFLVLLALTAVTFLIKSYAQADNSQSPAPVTSDKPTFVLIDLPIMNEGYGKEERSEYNKKIERIATKYGVERTHSFDIIEFMGGGMTNSNVLELNLWQMDSPDNMNAFAQDPEYQKLIPGRDKIHNMKDVTLYMATPQQAIIPTDPSKFILVDLVVMDEGYGKEEREAYSKQVMKIAQKYDVKRIHSYKILNHLGGQLPNVTELSLWEMPDPSAIQKLSQDPEYTTLIPHRNKIHNMDQVTLLLAKPKKTIN